MLHFSSLSSLRFSPSLNFCSKKTLLPLFSNPNPNPLLSPRKRFFFPGRRRRVSSSLGAKPMESPAVSSPVVTGSASGDREVDRVRLKLEELNWDHSFIRELPGDPRSDTIPREVLHACYTRVSPSAEVDNPQLVAWSDSVAELLDLDPQEFDRPDFSLIFSGALPLVGGSPYAQCYGGHQFGVWAGQLGDGRAITLGEILNSRGERWELQLKGAGKTPYSRFADGLAVLRSSIREFLCSEAMNGLGIPTTRALCLVTTGKYVTRDMFYEVDAVEDEHSLVTVKIF